MSNIVNFDRDMFWTGFVNATFVSGAFGADPLDVGSSSDVGQRVSGVNVLPVAVTQSAGNVMSAGCLILPPPDGDAVPYRVRGYATGGLDTLWRFGYRTAGLGVEEANQCTLIGAGPCIDTVVLINPLDSGDTHYGDPLIFFGSVAREAAADVAMSLSVQRLIAKPPQYASAVS